MISNTISYDKRVFVIFSFIIVDGLYYISRKFKDKVSQICYITAVLLWIATFPAMVLHVMRLGTSNRDVLVHLLGVYLIYAIKFVYMVIWM